MKYKKGQSGNPKGKPKGAENKVAKELKEIIKEVLEKEFEIIEDNFIVFLTSGKSTKLGDFCKKEIKSAFISFNLLN